MRELAYGHVSPSAFGARSGAGPGGESATSSGTTRTAGHLVAARARWCAASPRRSVGAGGGRSGRWCRARPGRRVRRRCGDRRGSRGAAAAVRDGRARRTTRRHADQSPSRSPSVSAPYCHSYRSPVGSRTEPVNRTPPSVARSGRAVPSALPGPRSPRPPAAARAPARALQRGDAPLQLGDALVQLHDCEIT